MGKLFSVSRIAAGIVLLLAAAHFAFALELQPSADAAELTACSQAVVRVLATGAQPGQQVLFSADNAIVAASIDSPAMTASSSGSAGTNVLLSVPACFIGTKNFALTAQACGNGQCTTASKTIRVTVRPCSQFSCTNYNYIDQQPVAAAAATCGQVDCKQVYGKIEFRQIFDPSTYSLRATPLQKTANVFAGGKTAVSYRVENIGAAGSFSVKAFSNGDGITIVPSRTFVELQRGEQAQLSFTIIASPTAASGSHSFVLSFLKDNFEVARTTGVVTVAAPSKRFAQLTFPQVPNAGIAVLDCQVGDSLKINAHLENTLDTRDFRVSATVNGVPAFSRDIRVPDGVVAEFPVTIPAAFLAKGVNRIVVEASTPGFGGSGVALVTVSQCAAAAVPQEPTQVNNEITVVVAVRNDGNETLRNVTLAFEGLPAFWNVSSQSVDVPAGSEANVSAKIIAGTSDVVEPTVVVKSNGNEIGRSKLASVNKPQGITGFFAAAVNGSLLIFFVAIAVVVVVFTYAHSKQEAESEAQREAEYREKMSKIRERLAGKEKPVEGDAGTIK